jgi:hypothetical protein
MLACDERESDTGMRPLRGYYWLLRANTSTNWWLVRYDLHTTWLFLRYAFLALRGRVLILDERIIEQPNGPNVLQWDLSPLPLETGGAPPGDTGISVRPSDQPPQSSGLLFPDWRR